MVLLKTFFFHILEFEHSVQILKFMESKLIKQLKSEFSRGIFWTTARMQDFAKKLLMKN